MGKQEINFQRKTSPYIDYVHVIIGDDNDNINIQSAIQSLIDLVYEINKNSKHYLLHEIGISSWLSGQYQFMYQIAKSEVCCRRSIKLLDQSTQIRGENGQFKILTCCEFDCDVEHPVKIIDDIIAGRTHIGSSKGCSIARIVGENVEIYQYLINKAPGILTDSILDGFELRHKMFVSLYEAFKVDQDKKHEDVRDNYHYTRAIEFLGGLNSIKTYHATHY